YPVAGQAKVPLHSPPGEKLITSHKLQTSPVTPVHISPRIGPHVVDLPGQDQLVLIVHVIGIGRYAEPCALPVPASFQVIKPLGPGKLVGCGLKIMSIRLLIGYGGRQKELLSFPAGFPQIIAQSDFGIEEMVFTPWAELGVIPETENPIIHITPLQVRKPKERF